MASRNYIMSRLNDRERVILNLSINAFSDRQIGEALSTSADVVKQTRLKALRKLAGEYREELQPEAA